MKTLSTLTLALTLTACVPTPKDVQPAPAEAELYPDYRDVVLPCNIAPLNFLVRNEGVDALQLTAGDATLRCRGNKLVWNEAEWHQWLGRHTGDTVPCTLTARIDGQWQEFKPFQWVVSRDSIDRYVTYRLIEPGYEVWHEVEIEERCLEDFSTRTLADGKRLGNRCMNCHTHGGQKGELSYFYVRGQGGGTIVNRNGQLRKMSLVTPRANGSSVYGDWHPSGRYGVFSTNQIIPAFHSDPARRLEVYDTRSDLMVADFDTDSLLTQPEVSQSDDRLETFPCFSADGEWIYFCAASNPLGTHVGNAAEMMPTIDTLRYALWGMPFDAGTGQMGTPMLIYAREGSVSMPKCSPDGAYLAYTASDYGTFPIWHREARMELLDCQALKAGNATSKTHAPALHPICRTDIHATYHSWSHNSRWIVFASKAEDTQYGRIQMVHIEADGDSIRLSKALTLPQADPSADDWNLRSYNIPDLSDCSMPFTTDDVAGLCK